MDPESKKDYLQKHKRKVVKPLPEFGLKDLKSYSKNQAAKESHRKRKELSDRLKD